MDKRHRFSARVFLGAGLYGVAVLLPRYFLEERLARDFPPPLTLRHLTGQPDRGKCD